MEKLLKMEKYQFLHNFVYWCGMIGIFVLGFLLPIPMCRKLWDRQEERHLPLQIFLTEWCMILRFSLSLFRGFLL